MADVRTWLEELGLGEYADAFAAERITFDDLAKLDVDDLKELGLPIGPRKRVLAAIDALASADASGASSSAPLRAERRQITVMFCDLVGSTALSEQLDPEDLRELMQAYQEACGAVIERYGGHVAQYLGDGLMTYFGWPRAHEDDAERAIRAGLDIVGAVKKVKAPDSLPGPLPDPLQVRVGIATGPVVVGETGGGDASVPKLAVGETPNLAARVQGLAAADQIVIGSTTRRLVGDTFDLDDLGAHSLKGIVEPVQTWRVTGVAQTEGRFEARGGHLTPFVGRDAEIAMIVERWDQANAGEGQAVFLSGEPGIGKSRITQVLRERVADEPHIRLRYQCSPYYTNSALYPVIEQLERAAGFARDDSAAAKLDKLERLLRQSTSDVTATAALFAPLLNVDSGDRYPALNVSPQKQKEMTLQALADQVIGLAAKQPVLMIFEDAHWIDPTTHETLDLIVPAIAGHRVLVVITYRPEYEPPWAGLAHATPLTLTRLGKANAAAMVERVTGGKLLPDDVLDQIVAKTDGVPLFVEELTKTVLESGAETAHTIPSTLQDSLMARLDRLSPVKETAQIGACIGREFSHELLAAVSPLGENELNDALQQLINSELIYRSGSSYAFKHALIQDVAYVSLLKIRRQDLHGQIASVLRTRLAETVASRPEVLAHHLTEAGDAENAVDYWHRAGKLAFVASAFAEADAHLRRGLELIPEVGDEQLRGQFELGIRTILGLTSLNMYGYGADGVLASFRRAEELIGHAENASDLVPILSSLGAYYWARADLRKTVKYYSNLVSEAEKSADRDLLVLGRTWLGSIKFHVGEGAEGRALLEAALDVYDVARHGDLSIALSAHDAGIMASAWIAFTDIWLGFPLKARRQIDKTAAMSREIKHPVSAAVGLSMSAYGAAHLRDGQRAADLASECIVICEDQNIPYWMGWAKVARGAARNELGDYVGALEDLAWAKDLMDSNGSFQTNGWINLHRAEIELNRRRLDEAEDAVWQVRQHVASSGEVVMSPLGERLAAEVELARDGIGTSRAESWLIEALRVSREQKYRLNELRLANSIARLWQSQGKHQQAHDLLAPIYGWFTEGFDTKDLLEARALLDELEAHYRQR